MSSGIRYLFLIIVSLFILSNSDIHAQSGKLPPFSIMQTNGKTFKAQNLPFEKPIIIIYFSPDCEDCLLFMDKLFNRITDFSKVSIVMITFLPIENVAKFTVKYKTDRYKNITVGTEGSSFFVKDYYQIMELPFAALYDKNGNIQSSYQKKIPLKKLIDKLQNLR